MGWLLLSCGQVPGGLNPTGLEPDMGILQLVPTQRPFAASRTGPGTRRRREAPLESDAPAGRGATVWPLPWSVSNVFGVEGESVWLPDECIWPQEKADSRLHMFLLA
jgi:hypothetical protein